MEGSAAELSPKGGFDERPAPSLLAGSQGSGVGFVLLWGTSNPFLVSTAPVSAHLVAPPAFQNHEVGFSIVCPPALGLLWLLLSLLFSSA